MAVDRPCGRAESHLQPQFEASSPPPFCDTQTSAIADVRCAVASALAERWSVRSPALLQYWIAVSAQSSLGKVTRQNLRLIFGDFNELAFEGLCDASDGLAPQIRGLKTRPASCPPFPSLSHPIVR